MSHYVVGVISKDKSEDAIARMLEPYNENLEVDRYIVHTHDDYLEEAKSEKEKIIAEGLQANYKRLMRDTAEIMSVDEVESIIADCAALKLDSEDEEGIKSVICNKHVGLADWTLRKICGQIGRCLVYYNIVNSSSDEELFKAYCEYDCVEPDSIDDDGNITSTYNTNAKWDWWTIGGRWSNMLKKKDGTLCNAAKIKDLDFSPNEDDYARAERFWDVVVGGLPQKEGEDIFAMYKPQFYLERYHDKETYAKIMSLPIPYAVLNEEGWHAKGEMGWFGMSSESGDESLQWDLNFYDIFLKTADPEAYFIVVDCHI